ncbi:Sporulation inhibitor A [Mesobacillus persicus]|uniref:Sporulation inhibitor A n=1 Tax=Mesobacillus persicus TaxID=930146 RepID=A0A1H8B0M4_9BACI|nr:sporulation histidine kinase inhibitor Sda [Mesobacillus persicus]SEM75739.1 Sporulation inhibitor A [Mesobacillus persicus]
MHLVPDELLLDSYQKAMKRNLDQQFIELLEEEIKRRNLVARTANDSVEKKKFNF